jgi:hypothetical protein
MATLTKEEQDADLLYNNELADMPGFTLEEREEFNKWLDHIQTVCMNVFYATAPDELWKDKDVFNFVLIGQTDKRDTTLARGMYCIDLHASFDAAYRDPVALAFDYLAKAPEHFKFVPAAISAVLPKPTAHERFSAKMFFRKLINDNAENQDLCEWASKLK